MSKFAATTENLIFFVPWYPHILVILGKEWKFIFQYRPVSHMKTPLQTWKKSMGPAIQSPCEDQVESTRGRGRAKLAMLVVLLDEKEKLDGVGPVDNRPSTD